MHLRKPGCTVGGNQALRHCPNLSVPMTNCRSRHVLSMRKAGYCRATPEQPFPLPEDFMQELAQSPGVRVVMARQGGDEEEDDEEWDEVMADLENPWMAEPHAASDILETQAPTALAPQATGAPFAAPGGAAAEGTGSVGAASGVPAGLPPLSAEVQDVGGPDDLRALLASQPHLVVLDVRRPEEAAERPLAGVTLCPIQSLTGDRAKQLASQPVLVLNTGDYRGSQACVRLARVYGALEVYYYEPGLEGWPAGLQLPGAAQ